MGVGGLGVRFWPDQGVWNQCEAAELTEYLVKHDVSLICRIQ